MELTEDFEEREESIRENTRKLDEKRRFQVEKRVKKTRDETGKEKGKRYYKNILLLPIKYPILRVTCRIILAVRIKKEDRLDR